MGKIGNWLARKTEEDREFVLTELIYHLVENSQFGKVHRFLTDFEFMQAKIKAVGIQALIEDYQRVEHLETDETLRLLQRTFELSDHVLNQDRNQLASQLWGRLLSHENNPKIQQLLQQAKRCQTSPWLRPTVPNLTPPGGALIRTLVGHSGSVNAVAITPDSSKLVSGSWDNTIKVWDLASGKQLLTLREHNSVVMAVAISPDGSKLVSGSNDNTIKAWDLASGKQLFNLGGHDDHDDLVWAVAISPDGLKLVSGASDNTIKVWDLVTGKKLLSLSEYSVEHSINAVAISPDGSKVVSASSDKTVKVWDLNTGKEMITFIGDSDFNCCAISPDNQTIVAGDSSGILHFLRIEGLDVNGVD
ncbi:WD domain, G-beta repeat protein [Lyngbya aestuarii BL J]|uniref:WD domain, G-beta repeat protein n=2 Tax=Lyngbya aestuarii BL J TaxID=1348334 RepID=U7Q8G6_9CYAN|nr:WD40 repeat domain-containing protein [Lyngbya aestuarii]ERT04088.1 WD domain, G-beta repeat protein [Lyngbya aestuarii BL J]